jgi:UV DNA damage repair endonuclease
MKLRGIFQFTEVQSFDNEFDERELKRISVKNNETSLNFCESFSIKFFRVSSGISNKIFKFTLEIFLRDFQ